MVMVVFRLFLIQFLNNSLSAVEQLAKRVDCLRAASAMHVATQMLDAHVILIKSIMPEGCSSIKATVIAFGAIEFSLQFSWVVFPNQVSSRLFDHFRFFMKMFFKPLDDFLESNEAENSDDVPRLHWSSHSVILTDGSKISFERSNNQEPVATFPTVLGPHYNVWSHISRPKFFAQYQITQWEHRAENKGFILSQEYFNSLDESWKMTAANRIATAEPTEPAKCSQISNKTRSTANCASAKALSDKKHCNANVGGILSVKVGKYSYAVAANRTSSSIKAKTGNNVNDRRSITQNKKSVNPRTSAFERPSGSSNCDSSSKKAGVRLEASPTKAEGNANNNNKALLSSEIELKQKKMGTSHKFVTKPAAAAPIHPASARHHHVDDNCILEKSMQQTSQHDCHHDIAVGVDGVITVHTKLDYENTRDRTLCEKVHKTSRPVGILGTAIPTSKVSKKKSPAAALQNTTAPPPQRKRQQSFSHKNKPSAGKPREKEPFTDHQKPSFGRGKDSEAVVASTTAPQGVVQPARFPLIGGTLGSYIPKAVLLSMQNVYTSIALFSVLATCGLAAWLFFTEEVWATEEGIFVRGLLRLALTFLMIWGCARLIQSDENDDDAAVTETTLKVVSRAKWHPTKTTKSKAANPTKKHKNGNNNHRVTVGSAKVRQVQVEDHSTSSAEERRWNKHYTFLGCLFLGCFLPAVIFHASRL